MSLLHYIICETPFAVLKEMGAHHLNGLEFAACMSDQWHSHAVRGTPQRHIKLAFGNLQESLELVTKDARFHAAHAPFPINVSKHY